ncbi:hypothetical protein T484DRAFT_1774095, partial [Baffinella frigidus]
VQRLVIALDLPGLMAFLKRCCALDAGHATPAAGAATRLSRGVLAHIALFFKTVLFLHGGRTLEVPNNPLPQ